MTIVRLGHSVCRQLDGLHLTATIILSTSRPESRLSESDPIADIHASNDFPIPGILSPFPRVSEIRTNVFATANELKLTRSLRATNIIPMAN